MWLADVSPLLARVQPSIQDGPRSFPAGLLCCQLLFRQMCGALLPQVNNFALLVEAPEFSQSPSRFSQVEFLLLYSHCCVLLVCIVSFITIDVFRLVMSCSSWWIYTKFGWHQSEFSICFFMNQCKFFTTYSWNIPKSLKHFSFTKDSIFFLVRKMALLSNTSNNSSKNCI